MTVQKARAVPSISVVIPAFNEEKRLPGTMREVIKYLDHLTPDYELIVVDDGSSDHTIEVAQAISNRGIRVLKNGKNRGKGYSVKHGMLAATKEWMLFTDADLSVPTKEWDKFFDHLDHDVIIGSRRLSSSKIVIRQPWYREFSGRAFNAMVRLLVVPGIRDTQCGMKLFSRHAAQEIFSKQTIEGWGFDVEIIFIALKQGYKIKEIPIEWYNDVNSKVKMLRDTYRMCKDIVRIRINHTLGKYA